jgi:phage tail sheath protein FI
VIFGQKTLNPNSTSLDRVNVARLVAYLNERFTEIARPLLFAPNTKLTRDRAILIFESFLSDILTKNGISDFAVVCDTTNNSALQIARSELYIDVAITPVRAVEFIYIPIRIDL